MVTYGVILNAVNLAGDLYLNIVFMGLVQPGTLIPAFTLEIPGLGRRKHVLGGFILTGASLFLCLAVPESKCSSLLQSGIMAFQVKCAPCFSIF